jgi:hypothetical protein
MKIIFSIRNKLVLSSSLFIALLLGVIAAGTYAYFRNTTRQLIFEQQFSLITVLAHDLDHELTRAQKSLINVAPVRHRCHLEQTIIYMLSQVLTQFLVDGKANAQNAAALPVTSPQSIMPTALLSFS